MLICWILVAGSAQLLGHLIGGKGSFEGTLSVFGFVIGLASLASLLNDLPSALFGAIGLFDLREYEIALNSPNIWRTILWVAYGLYTVLFLILFPKAVGAAQRIRGLRAVYLGVFSFVIYQLVFLVFNH